MYYCAVLHSDISSSFWIAISIYNISQFGHFVNRKKTRLNVWQERCVCNRSKHINSGFPPSSCVSPHLPTAKPYGQGQLDAIDFVAIAIPSLCSLRHAHIRDIPLIIPLATWVGKTGFPGGWRTFIWCLALAMKECVATRL